MTRKNSSSHVAHPAMYRGFARLLLGLLICVSVSGGRLAAEPASDDGRPSLSLDGVWQFRIDPNDEGTSAGWFNADVPFPETIRVPGNWQAQGFGEPRNHLSHDYQGKAWYRRTIDYSRELGRQASLAPLGRSDRRWGGLCQRATRRLC